MYSLDFIRDLLHLLVLGRGLSDLLIDFLELSDILLHCFDQTLKHLLHRAMITNLVKSRKLNSGINLFVLRYNDFQEAIFRLFEFIHALAQLTDLRGYLVSILSLTCSLRRASLQSELLNPTLHLFYDRNLALHLLLQDFVLLLCAFVVVGSFSKLGQLPFNFLKLPFQLSDKLYIHLPRSAQFLYFLVPLEKLLLSLLFYLLNLRF